MIPGSFFALSDHLEALSKHGDPLEVLGYGDGAKGGLRLYDAVPMKNLPVNAVSGSLEIETCCGF